MRSGASLPTEEKLQAFGEIGVKGDTLLQPGPKENL